MAKYAGIFEELLRRKPEEIQMTPRCHVGEMTGRRHGPGAFSPAGGRFLDIQLFADGEDKTEEPTPHRRREARKRGQVMKSMEVNAAVNMLAMVLLFAVFWRYFLNGFTSTLQHYLSHFPGTEVDMLSLGYLTRFAMERSFFFGRAFSVGRAVYRHRCQCHAGWFPGFQRGVKTTDEPP